MFIVTGTYNWRPRIVAFRNDYCRHCRSETLSTAQRSWDFLHVFWIPVLPLGAWTRWFCGRCGRDPHEQAGVRRPFRLLLVVLVALLTLAIWLTPTDNAAEAPVIHAFRWLGIAGTMAAAWWTISYQPEGPWKEHLSVVEPWNEANCPLCGGVLFRSLEGADCNDCGAQHRPLERKTQDLTYS